MKDLDFDELDRAVNSLISPKATPQDDAAVPSASPSDNNLPTTDNTPTPTADPTIAPSQPLAARRSSGRFMDVVHPSSDMRTTTPASKPVSREGATISAAAAPVEENQSATDWTPAETPSSQVDETPTPATSDWPDPLDMPSFSSLSTPKPSETPAFEPTTSQSESVTDEDGDINDIANPANTSTELGAQAPQESPFLMDTKVSKRPLGAFSVDAAVPADPVIEPADVTPVLDSDETARFTLAVNDGPQEAQRPVDLDNDAPLPSELQDDVLLLEAGADTVEQTSSAPEFTGPTSITQQYTEQPSTGDQPTGAIFDTEAYHKPLAHPTKKKSGWLWVVWIVLLLIIGAGVGAGVYFYVLPLL